MTLNCIFWWGSNLGSLGSLECPFIAVKPRYSLTPGVVVPVEIPSLDQIDLCPISWGCRIHWYPHSMSVLDMILNNLMVRFQWCWIFGKCRVPLYCHCSQVHSGPGVVASDRALSMGLNRTNGILMLNWIVWLNWIAWNRNVFDNQTVLTFKLHAYAKLNYLKWNCFLTLKLYLD